MPVCATGQALSASVKRLHTGGRHVDHGTIASSNVVKAVSSRPARKVADHQSSSRDIDVSSTIFGEEDLVAKYKQFEVTRPSNPKPEPEPEPEPEQVGEEASAAGYRHPDMAALESKLTALNTATSAVDHSSNAPTVPAASVGLSNSILAKKKEAEAALSHSNSNAGKRRLSISINEESASAAGSSISLPPSPLSVANAAIGEHCDATGKDDAQLMATILASKAAAEKNLSKRKGMGRRRSVVGSRSDATVSISEPQLEPALKTKLESKVP
eukprot:COSAG01_NODE_22359_length_859_cov_0.775000_1_plen_270_part_10